VPIRVRKTPQWPDKLAVAVNKGKTRGEKRINSFCKGMKSFDILSEPFYSL
jgi:hypothetical protein